MILTKNRLKKNKFKDDDDMLYQLKFSHLEPIKEDNILKIKTSDRGTQAPDIMNNFSQTDRKVMLDKETDTYDDDLNIIDPPYYLTSTLSGFKSKEPSRAEKMAQVWSTTLEKKTPPSSNSEDDNFMSRNIDRGLRMAQLTGSAMLTAFNLADTVGSAVLSPVVNSTLDLVMNNPSDENEDEENDEEENVEEEEEEPQQEAQVLRDSEDENVGNSLLRRGASRSRSSTPKGGYASSGSLNARGGYPSKRKDKR